MASYFDTILRKSHAQLHDDVKIMFAEMNKMVNDKLKQQIPRDKFNELEATVNCLAQSSISSDVFREIKSLIRHLAADNEFNSSTTHPTNSLTMLHKKLSQIYAKMQMTIKLCTDVRDCVQNTFDENMIKTEEQIRQLSIVCKIQNENEMLMKEILLQMDYLDLIGKEKTM